ncbi:hypothetical protein CSA08_01505 [Candidatus Gracilibacteria bacterium]|nr:MAG: hypothetical protein CSA08_01505 [Candidatus Gracilibacteria bacterium]
MIVEATDGEYNIEGIKYFNEFNTGGTVKKIVGQLIVDGKIIGDSSTPTSVLPYGLGTHSFSDKVQDRNFNIKTKLRGDYKFNLQFFDKTSSGDLIQVGNDVEFPLTIIPTNEMRVEGLGVVSYPGGAYPYSNADQKNDNTDVAKICYNITDNFSNPIGYDSVGLSNGYQVISGTGYNSLRTPDFGNYQTGHGNNIKGVAVNFSSDFNSHLLSSGSVYNNKGIALDQRSGEPYVEAIEIKDQPGIGNSGPYDTGPGYSYTGPGDDKHLVTFRGSRACFNIQSYAPANKRLRFKLTLPTHNRDYDITPDGGVKTLSQALTNYVRFEKPFSGDFVIDNDTEFKAGTEQTMRIDVKKNNSRCPSSICSDDFTITNYLSSLTSTNGYYSVIRKDNEINTIGTVLPPVFPLPSTDPWMVPSPINRTKLDFVLNYISLDKISDHPSYGIKTEPFITNEVNGKDVIYRLNTSAGGDNSWMEETKSVFYGLDADGVIEGDAPISNNANYTITGQQSAFTSLDKLEMRKQIKSNAYNLIRGRSSGSNVSGVLYYDGNYTISSAPAGVNTLIIKNGNLFITGDIATNLGIIVIKDNLADKTVGNVYITPNVTEINAIIYADGSLLSKSNSGFYTHNGTISGNPEDSPTRTNELQNDLILIGSLFSRNTIGGAIGAGPFKCPGGKTCSSFDEAVKYDLNYIRRGPNGFKVEYNPANQINPPKGFEK